MIFRGLIISSIVLLSSLIWSSYVDKDKSDITSNLKGTAPIVSSKSSNSATELAEHLSQIGGVQYSAYWCPHCHDQKEMFGQEAASKLNIVECAKDGQNNQHSLCEAKGIDGYPSWELYGKIESGVKSLEELAKSGKIDPGAARSEH